MADNSTVEVVLKINAKQFERGVKNATRVYATSTQDIAGVNATASNSMGSLTNKVLALGAAYLTVSNSIGLVKQLLATGGNFESLRIQLETLTGSAKNGEQAFDWIKTFVKETPFGLDDVTKGFIKLKAFGLDPMDGSYQAIADQAAALGGGQEKLNGIILAVGQAWAKQKLQGEETLQLVERGVPVWDLLAEATGKSTVELNKLSEQGKLGRETIKLLVDEMGKGVDGAALKQVETWNGLVSNAQVEWQQFLDTIAQSGSLDFFKDELTDLLTEIERLANNGELEEYAQEVSAAIINLSKTLSSVVGVIVGLREEIVFLGEVLIVSKVLGYGGALNGLAAAAIAATGATKGLTLATKIFKATVTFGLAIALDYAIKKYYEMETATEAAIRANKELAKANEKESVRVQKEIGQLQFDKLNAAIKRQAAIHAVYADKIKKTKAIETKAIKEALTEQLSAYEKHLKGLKSAQQQQIDIAKEFADFVAGISSASGVDDPDILDFASAITAAKRSLSEGDFDGAIDGARGLADMIQTMRDNGTEADIVLLGLAQQAEKLANDAASKRVDQEADSLKKAEATLDTLVQKADFLKNIGLGFDNQAALSNLSAVQNLMQKQLTDNPLLIAIKTGNGPELSSQSNKLLDELGLNQTIPDVPQLPENTTPIIRPLQLDTTEAEQQLDEITQKAAQAVTKKIFVSADGTSFSDRSDGTNAVFKDEALQKGRKL